MWEANSLSLFLIKVFVSVLLLLPIITFLSLFNKRRILKFSKTINGPTFYPLIGNAYVMIGKDIFGGLNGLYEKFSLPCNLWVGHEYNYVTNRAGDINTVLNHPKCFNKARLYQDLHLVFGNTLLMLNYDTWKIHRKYFSRSFSTKILRSFVPIFSRKSEILLKVLKDIDKNTDRFEIFEKFALDTFCEANIGIDMHIQEQHNVAIDLITEAQSILGKRILEQYIPFTLWKLFTKQGRRFTIVLKYWQDFVFKILQRKREEFKSKRDYMESDMLPLADSMLHSEGIKFDDTAIFDELLLFAGGATDTSGYTLAYTFMLLGMHPEIQQRLYNEVITTVGDREITYEDLSNLKYTECVIQESLRILPATPFIGRHAGADIDLGDRILPKGSNVVLCIYHVHRNEKYWKNPLKFDPERFSPENFIKIEPGSYIPFSGGIRNCIGRIYAMMALKMVVANVVRKFQLHSGYKSVTELELTSCVTMKTVHKLDCDFVLRNN